MIYVYNFSDNTLTAIPEVSSVEQAREHMMQFLNQNSAVYSYVDKYGIVYEEDTPVCYYLTDEDEFEFEIGTIGQLLDEEPLTADNHQSLSCLEKVYTHLVNEYIY